MCQDVTLNYKYNGKTRWVTPDIVISKALVIEVYGDYWHANPNIYKPYDIVHHNITAQSIWDADRTRNNIIESVTGYVVYPIWVSELKKNLKHIANNIFTLYEMESCAF